MSRTKSDKNGNTAKSESSVWTRAITANSEWPDKEEFLDVIYWSRQAIGIIVGVGWGLIPLRGFVALLLCDFEEKEEFYYPLAYKLKKKLRFFLVNAGVLYVYFSNFQQVDEEEYGGAWELTKEGFMTSFAGFLVTWIIIYSGLHFD